MKITARVPLLSAMLLAEAALGLPVRAEDVPLVENSVRAPLVVIGASASAGFVPSEPFGGAKTPQYRLSHYLAASFLHSNVPTQSLAASTFFLEADNQAERQIQSALEANPSAVVGIDFLFWFCYGRVSNEVERSAKFERGLAYLERLKCPLVIGDIPDASGAAGGMLSAKQIPPPEAIAAANRRLAEWASAHNNVSLLSLSEFMSACLENRALAVGPLAFSEGQTRKLLQSDKLHPARHGCAVLALAVMNALTKQRSLVAENDVRWDVEDVFQRAVKASGAPASPPAKNPVPAGR
jgi:hypothetical protein